MLILEDFALWCLSLGMRSHASVDGNICLRTMTMETTLHYTFLPNADLCRSHLAVSPQWTRDHGHFSPCSGKMPDRSESRKNGFILVQSLQIHSIIMGKMEQQVCEAPGHIVATGSIEKWCWCPVHLHFWFNPGPQYLERCCPYLGCAIPLYLIQSTHAQRFVSYRWF